MKVTYSMAKNHEWEAMQELDVHNIAELSAQPPGKTWHERNPATGE
jgi:hypothetical protein